MTASSTFALFSAFSVATTSAFVTPQHAPTMAVTSSTTAIPAALTTYLDDDNYQPLMEENGKAVLVDCCAQWCGPCKLIEPFLEDAADTFQDRLDVVKFDVERPKTSGVKVELLLQEVLPQALPALILFHNGKAIATHTGAIHPDDLNEFIERHLASLEQSRVTVGAGKKKSRRKGLVSLFGQAKDDYML